MNKEQFLAMSLPHGLKVCVKEYGGVDNSLLETMRGIVDDRMITDDIEDDNFLLKTSEYLCVLHPLSDLTKPIEHKGETFILIDKILESGGFNLSKMSRQEINSYAKPFLMPELISLDDALILIEHHFDIAGLIEKGEAIDVNTLEINPYK